ncbi:MAG: alpha-L-fucosidase [Planctomycetota bacterium]
MTLRLAALLGSFALSQAAAVGSAQAAADYQPTWESLGAHRAAPWFAQAKLGVFVQWGVYSVPAWSEPGAEAAWYWRWVETGAHGGRERRFHERSFGAEVRYEELATRFRAELFDPVEWSGILSRSGARYVVLTAKHRDGFALWPSEHASHARGHAWSAMDAGPRRDLVGELTDAVRAAGLRMGLAYSTEEWNNPVLDRSPGEYVESVLFPQVRDLVRSYSPDVLWIDGDWDEPEAVRRTPELLASIYNHAARPAELVVSDRFGAGLRGSVGDFSSVEGEPAEVAPAESRPWELRRSLGGSLALNRAEGYGSYLSRTECVRLLIDVASRGGNLLLGVGARADGRIPLLAQDRLRALGRWLEVNGEAIYGTAGSPLASTPWGAATTQGARLFLHIFDWPAEGRLELPELANRVRGARILSDARRRPLPVEPLPAGGVAIDLAGQRPFEHATVIALELDGAPRTR